MKISNVFSGQPDVTLGAKRPDTPDAAAGATAAPANAAAQPNRSMAAAKEILAKYDVKNITPDQFSQLVQKLYEAGAISEEDSHELAGIRADMDSAGIAPDESINLLDFYHDRVAQTQKKFDADTDATARQQQMSPLLRRLDWLEKFSAVHTQPEAAGLNAVA